MTVYKLKLLVSLILAVSILIVQTGGVFAASDLQTFPPISGIVQSITVETNTPTGVTTVLVTVLNDNQVFQNIRVSQKTAEKLGLIVSDNDGKPLINKSALGRSVEIKLNTVIPDQEEDRHPVGDALATFFSDSLNVGHDLLYDTIMAAHEEGFELVNGFGFGVIAQALWMTQQIPDGDLPEIGDNLAIFKALLIAKQNDDYSQFENYKLEDGTSPMNWGQLRKAILQTNKKNGSDMTSADQNNENNQKQNKNKDKEKDKGGNKDKEKTK